MKRILYLALVALLSAAVANGQDTSTTMRPTPGGGDASTTMAPGGMSTTTTMAPGGMSSTTMAGGMSSTTMAGGMSSTMAGDMSTTMPPMMGGSGDMETWEWVAILVPSIVGGLALLTLIVYCCCCNKGGAGMFGDCEDCWNMCCPGRRRMHNNQQSGYMQDNRIVTVERANQYGCAPQHVSNVGVNKFPLYGAGRPQIKAGGCGCGC